MKKHDDKSVQSETKREEYLKEIEVWKNKYLRALADYQNLERRTVEEKSEARKHASEFILQRLLPVADTFKRASEHLKDEGLDLAFKELEAVFDEQGVTKIHCVGKPFNPHEMECIEVVTGEDGMVIEETLPGYKLHDKILRVAQVKVGKK